VRGPEISASREGGEGRTPKNRCLEVGIKVTLDGLKQRRGNKEGGKEIGKTHSLKKGHVNSARFRYWEVSLDRVAYRRSAKGQTMSSPCMCDKAEEQAGKNALQWDTHRIRKLR